MTVKLTNIWTGCYVGDGEYEGGSWDDRTFTRVRLDTGIYSLLNKLRKSMKQESGYDIFKISDKITFTYTILETGETFDYSI